jgi:signal recognition particle receptor subunit beta
VYDATNRASFEQLAFWAKFLRDHSDNPNVLIFANKTDLTGLQTVTRKEAEVFAESLGAMLIEGSAQNGQNVRTVFQMMATLLRASSPRRFDSHGTEVAGRTRVVSSGDDKDGATLWRWLRC